MTRTQPNKPDDAQMWRFMMAWAHPDSSGDHEGFLWVQALRDVVCDGVEHRRTVSPRHEPEPGLAPRREPRHSDQGAVPFDPDLDFKAVTENALTGASTVSEPYARLLRFLAACEAANFGPLRDQQQWGATYKQLAAIGHRAGMSKEVRLRWYRIAESVPLSCRHAGHILSKLKRRTV